MHTHTIKETKKKSHIHCTHIHTHTHTHTPTHTHTHTHTHTTKRQKRNLIYTLYLHEIEQQSSIECILLVVKQTMLTMPLLVRGYVVRWLKYYCTFRMTHTCTVRHMYIHQNKLVQPIILLLEIVTIPIQTCIPTADLDYGEDIMFYKWQNFHKNN